MTDEELRADIQAVLDRYGSANSKMRLDIQYAIDPNSIAVTYWHIDDMRPEYDEDDMPEDWCCDECARALLYTCHKRFDASIGLSWDVIDVHRSYMPNDCKDAECCFFHGNDDPPGHLREE